MSKTTTALEKDSSATPGLDDAQGDIARFTKKKPRRRRIILIIVALVIAVLVVWKLMPHSTALPVETTALAKTSLEKAINLSGRIESASQSRVYSSQTGLVNRIDVQVGDAVKAGDVLAQLDITDLETELAIKNATLSVGAKTDAIALAAAEKQYNDMLSDLQNGMYAPLVSAEQSVATASKNLSEARRNYNDNDQDIDKADEEVYRTEKAMNAARREMEESAVACKANVGHSSVHSADCLAKQEAYQLALRAWKEAYNFYSTDMSSFGKAVQDSRLIYENALQNREVAQQEANRALKTLTDSIERAKLSGDMTADQLTAKKLISAIGDSTIKAPIDGVVTAIYAKIGAPGSGLLFIVEDLNHLVVKTSIREYDIATVEVGLPAAVKSDATGETEFDGTLSRISPAATKAADGSTQSSGNVEFEADVTLATPDSGLRVGMTVRLSLILAKKDDILALPIDAVSTDDKGQAIVYVARADAKGVLHAEPVPVTTGLETDFSVEIASDSLAEGDLVITTPAAVTPGAEVATLARKG
ncbi:MAG: efflux RND transporter periplasmic adaptor subunit [Oscillospiraceae bacterium]